MYGDSYDLLREDHYYGEATKEMVLCAIPLELFLTQVVFATVPSTASIITQTITRNTSTGAVEVTNLTTLSNYTASTNIDITSNAISVVAAPTFSGVTTVSNTTQSTSTSTGGLIAIGGLGIAKDAFLGGYFSCQSKQTLGSSNTISTSNTSFTTDGYFGLNHATNPMIVFRGTGSAIPRVTTRSFGTKIVLFPAVAGSVTDYAIGISANSTWWSVPDSSNFFRFFHNAVNTVTISSTQLLIAATAQSSSSSTGSLVTLGCLVVSKDVYIGGACKVTVTTQSTSSNTGPLVTLGVVGIAKDVYIGGRIYSPNTFKSRITGNYTPVVLSFTVPFNVVSGSGTFERGGANFDTSNFRYVCPVAGMYYFKIKALMNVAATQAQSVMSLTSSVANNTSRLYQKDYTGYLGTRQESIDGSTFLTCAANEQISVSFVFTGNFSTLIVGSSTGHQFTSFEGFFLG